MSAAEKKLADIVLELRVIESKLACADKRARFLASHDESYKDDVYWATRRIREILEFVDGRHTERHSGVRAVADVSELDAITRSEVFFDLVTEAKEEAS